MTTHNAASATTRSSSAAKVGAAALCALAIAGIVTAIMLAFGGSHATASTVTPKPAPTHSVPAKPATPATPSAAIESLQRQLGQLNYYEGPVTGVMNSQTEQAITYLQRDAHLPQTGQLNAATQSALARFLATGNNQMGN
jgi:peptidoglycan hydrolase-like protein with peptidoglycan-binding domain